MTSDKSIGIQFINLETRERAIFDRVIAFNTTHGLKAHTVNSSNEANLIIVSDTSVAEVAEFVKDKAIVVLSNDGSDAHGDLQIKRPLLITKVMNSLGEALEIAKQKASSEAAPEEQQLNKIDVADYVDSEQSNQPQQSESTAAVNTSLENNNADKTVEEETQALHALVIDDSAAIRKQLELELRDAGITSDFAESGEMALEKIKEHDFDLVFLDIIMPGIDGYETCKAMRATAEYKKTPIIMLSGKTSPLDEVQGVIAGATTYLTKPVKSDKLQETLNRVSKWISNFSAKKKTETT